MKLHIEKWIERVRPFDTSAEELFQESITCYKVGAYKSAFLMSYLAFKTTIKNRIINCSYRPDSYHEKEEEWQENVLSLLNNDDKWENHLNKIIEGDVNPQSTSTTRAIIFFSNREEAKNEYTYWKNVRNKCAHAKKGTIDSSTVESFWNYVQDNLSKFYVLGGRDYLVERMLDYYKYRDIENYTTKMLLINDINIVFNENTQDFFSIIMEKFYGINKYSITVDVEFWNDIVDSQYENIQKGFVNSVMTNSNYFIAFYEHYPKILNIAVSIEMKFIKDSLSKWIEEWFVSFTGSNNNFWNILCRLLREYNSEVDLNKIAGLDLSIIDNIELKDEMVDVLKKNRVFNRFVFNSGSYIFDVDFDSIRRNHGRREREIIPWFEYIEWDKDIVFALNRAYRELNRSIESKKKSMFGLWEYDRKTIYSDLINKYKERIDTTVIKELDLDDEFKSLIMAS